MKTKLQKSFNSFESFGKSLKNQKEIELDSKIHLKKITEGAYDGSKLNYNYEDTVDWRFTKNSFNHN